MTFSHARHREQISANIASPRCAFGCGNIACISRRNCPIPRRAQFAAPISVVINCAITGNKIAAGEIETICPINPPHLFWGKLADESLRAFNAKSSFAGTAP